MSASARAGELTRDRIDAVPPRTHGIVIVHIARPSIKDEFGQVTMIRRAAAAMP